MYQCLQDQRGDVLGKTTVRRYRELGGVGASITVDEYHLNSCIRRGGVLDGEPLIIADVVVAFGEAVDTMGGRPHFTNDIGTADRLSIPTIVELMIVRKVFFTLRHNSRASRSYFYRNLGGRVCKRIVGIDVKDSLRHRAERQGVRLGCPRLRF